MTQTPPTTAPEDDTEDEDDTVQGVSKRAETLRAEAERLQKEQNDAAGLTTPPAETPTTPPAQNPTSQGSRKPSSA